MKVWTRGGVRFAVEDGAVVVYIDADKLADATDFLDVPEVELGRISREDVGKFWGDVKAEAKRVQKRVKRLKQKVKK